MIRVFIADDHSVVRDGLARIVSAVAGLGCSGQAADVQGLLSSPFLDQTVTNGSSRSSQMTPRGRLEARLSRETSFRNKCFLVSVGSECCASGFLLGSTNLNQY